ncbi:MAG: chitobiase/beta-hexosaminidase C-terminal domain-containing protein [Fibrobacterota bacterium]|nr:chitobiase/beta-hexosaminidase C-terminal domain-containing protein [Fibrobacterota bacterium]QQS07214.1 MAG: chitobiase/beta-hexosaminidase C-terminal domain-containing protein [Fibrobacterota bacterium]
MIRPILRAILAIVAAFGLFAGCDSNTSSSGGGGTSSALEGVWVSTNGTSTETVTLLPGGVASLDSIAVVGGAIRGTRYEGTWTGTGNTGTITWTSVSTSTDGVVWTGKKAMSDGSYPIEVKGSVGVATVHGVKREYTKGTAAPIPVADVVTPTISLPTGSYASSQTVSITTATIGGTIRYTTDGTTPTASSTLYSSSISVSSTKTIKAITVLGTKTSSVASVTITIDAGPKPGTKDAALVGSWMQYDASAKLYRTLDFFEDGTVIRSKQSDLTSTPGWEDFTGTWSTSAGAITMTWVGARKSSDAVSWTDIAVPAPTRGTYTVSAGKLSLTSDGSTISYNSIPRDEEPDPVDVLAPVISPAGGTFTSAKAVTISAETGASIYYTTDGSTPSTSSTRYSGSINVASSKTIKAIAVLDGVSSAMVSASFTINTGTVTNPSIVGTWRIDDPTSSGGIIYDASGNLTLISKEVTDEGDETFTKVEGTYTTSGSSLVMTFLRGYQSADGSNWGAAIPIGESLDPVEGTFSVSGSSLSIVTTDSSGSKSTETFTKASSIF